MAGLLFRAHVYHVNTVRKFISLRLQQVYIGAMTHRVRVKICGLREPDQALKIAQMGADAIGLVFAPSPRQVSPTQARTVTDAIPSQVSAVGVFVDADAGTINRIAAEADLTMAQLHGGEPPGIVEDLSVPCIKAFRVRDENWIGEVRRWLDGVRDRQKIAAVLLDTYNPNLAGGTGVAFNWEWVAEARAGGKLADLPPLVLSGGLDAGNVVEAIRTVRPWMVDVSSGVESEPGVKDLKKAEEFIHAVRQ